MTAGTAVFRVLSFTGFFFLPFMGYGVAGRRASDYLAKR